MRSKENCHLARETALSYSPPSWEKAAKWQQTAIIIQAIMLHRKQQALLINTSTGPWTTGIRSWPARGYCASPAKSFHSAALRFPSLWKQVCCGLFLSISATDILYLKLLKWLHHFHCYEKFTKRAFQNPSLCIVLSVLKSACGLTSGIWILGYCCCLTSDSNC